MERQEQRSMDYDRELEVGLCRLEGIVQPFPSHFHSCYVVGVLRGGRRSLRCRGGQWELGPGDTVLFAPGESHSCSPVGAEPLDYWSVHIAPGRMEALTGGGGLAFAAPFARSRALYHSVEGLCRAVWEGVPTVRREEALAALIRQLEGCAAPDFRREGDPEVENLCRYIEEHCAEPLRLSDLLSRSRRGRTALREAFLRQVGLPPYRYLQAVRLDRAKRLPEQGVPPVEAAGRAGFCDQSHLSGYFKDCIGVTPARYERTFQRKRRETEP